MKKRKRRLWLWIPLFLAVFALVGSFVVGYFGLDYNWDTQMTALDMQVTAELTEDGDLRVSETTTYRYANRDRNYYNNYRTFSKSEMDGVADVAVYDHDQGVEYTFDTAHQNNVDASEAVPNTCYLDELSYGWEIGYHFPPFAKGERTFTLSYTLENVALIYEDADILYHQFRPAGQYPVGRFALELAYPDPGDGALGWLHCTAPSRLVFVQDGLLRITAEKVPQDTYIELRLMLPGGSLPGGSRFKDWSTWNGVVLQEQQWADDWDGSTQYRWFIAVCSVVGSVLLFALVCLLIRWEHARDRKTFPQDKEPPWQRTPPDPVSPAVASRLFEIAGEMKQKSEAGDNRLSATILAIAHKGWLVLDKNEKGELTMAPQQQGRQPLTSEEDALFRMLWQVGARYAGMYGGRFTMEQYKNFGREKPTVVQQAVAQYSREVSRGFRAQGWVQQYTALRSVNSWLAVVCIVMAVVVLGWMDFSGHGILFFGLLVCGIVAGLGAGSRTRLTPEGGAALLRWRGFARYLVEFTLLDERDAWEVGLWGDYLVYGTALGLGDAVSNSLGLAWGKLEEAAAEGAAAGAPPDGLPVLPMGGDPLGGYFGYSTVFHMMPGDTGASAGGFGRSLSDGLSSVLGDVRATGHAISHTVATSSSGGSGGSGGGGGGFSGGGGGSGGGSGGTR